MADIRVIRFGVTNLRRLQKVDPIPIKPITLLVGRNSGGKSTFLRAFPLIRQSLMTRTSSPILWYGDLVDFGAFDTSISRQSTDGSMSFTFVTDSIRTGREHVIYGDEFYFLSEKRDEVTFNNVSVTVYLSKSSDSVRISSVEYELSEIGTKISVVISDKGSSELFLNKRNIETTLEGFRLVNLGNSLLPEFRYLRERPTNPNRPQTLSISSPLFPALHKLLRSRISRRVSDRSITHLAAQLTTLGLPTDDRLLDVSRSEGTLVGKAISKIIEDKGPAYTELKDMLFLVWFPSFTKSVSQNIRSVFSSTLYTGPARARSERYYRYQELAVSEIDPDGKNFPMFLNSLSRRNLEDFSSWIRKMFGYGITLSRQSGHISINLVDGGRETNIVDVGYGVSQILPVLGQIWWAKARPTARPTARNERTPLSLLAIEQPELHLHPAHQALLADALVGEAIDAPNPSADRMHYLVETHSETLINRFGEFIAAGRISANDIQVVVFDNVDDNVTRVRTVNYDENGVLIDWPFGFFSAIYAYMIIRWSLDDGFEELCKSAKFLEGVSELLRASRMGAHLLVVERSLAKRLLDFGLADHEKALLQRLAQEFTQTGRLHETSATYIQIQNASDGRPVLAGSAVTVPFGCILQNNILSTPVLLVENVERDGFIYENILRFVLGKSGMGNMSVDIVHGGGTDTPKVLLNVLRAGRIVCVLADSDKDSPTSHNANTLKKLERIQSRAGWVLCSVHSPPCREVENLLLIDLVLQLPSAVGNQSNSVLLKIKKEEENNGTPPDDYYWSYFDVKRGIDSNKLNTLGEEATEWVSKKIALARDLDRPWSLPGYGDGVISQVMGNGAFVSELRKLIATNSWKSTFWNFFSIFSWVFVSSRRLVT